MQVRKRIVAWSAATAVALAGFGIRAVLADKSHDERPAMPESGRASPSLETETVADASLEGLSAQGTSWSGEVLSTADVSIHPSREGQIAEWHVRLGQRVRAGQVLGTLTPPPANLELASALAERSRALVLARAQAEAAATLAEKARLRLADLEAGLERARTAALDLSAAETERASALIPLKRQAARTAIERLATSLPGSLTVDGLSPATPEAASSLRFKTAFGVMHEASRGAYREAWGALLAALKDPETLPENEASRYAAAAQALLSYSTPIDGVSTDDLLEIRKDHSEAVEAFVEAMNEYKEASTARITRDAERSKAISDADLELSKERSGLAAQIAELERESEMAEAGVRAAEAAYGAIASGVAGQAIVSPKSGVVSAIFKNIGDHVTPETPVAGVSGAETRGRFVRFRIPSDKAVPEVGDPVRIERPGFPFSPEEGRIVGVGLALDDGGFFAADAEFVDPPDWPVHAPVRVIVPRQDARVLIPFSALWWDDAGAANVWLVTETGIVRPQPIAIGRALGDRVEVREGLESGSVFVVKAAEGIKTGMSVHDAATRRTEAAGQAEEAAGGDGHGHSHDE